MRKKGIASSSRPFCEKGGTPRNDGGGTQVAAPRPFWLGWVSIALIIILGCIVYSNSLGGKFVFDDARLVENNLYIKKWVNLQKIFTEDIGAGAGSTYNYYNFYRPIQMLTYMVDYSLWGMEPFGFHLTSMFLHIAAALALYAFLNVLFGDRRVSFLAAVLFIVHPLHTEAVSYIAGRADMLVALFLMVFLICYIKSAASGKLLYYLAAILSYTLACMSKEYSLIALPLVWLYHYTFHKKARTRDIISIGAITVVYIFLRATVFNFPTFNKAAAGSFFERLPGFFVAIAQYARLIVLPFGLHMEYGSPVFSYADPRWLAGALILGVLLFCILKWKDKSVIFFPLAWFLITLLPVSNLYPINAYMAEHWLYVPSMGIFFLTSYALFAAYDKRGFKIPVMIAMAALLAFYSYLTIQQNGYWKDSITFYTKTLRFNPESDRVTCNLATEYMMRGDYDKAIELFKKAAATSTDPAGLYNNLGITYSSIKKEHEAIEAYKKAVETNPAFAEAYNNLGVSYSQTGDKERAIEAFKKAVEINPNYADAYSNLGSEYTDPNEAIKACKKAIEINPRQANAYYNLSKAYNAIGDTEEGARMYRRAKELKPDIE